MSSYVPTKIDLTPRRHHGYAVLLFIMGTLFPPLAVAARFGIGSDFWLNLLLTICGYIPGHAHNFYIQNIRNNKNHARTPKWIQRYGLVDTSEIKRKERKSQWASRYNDRLPRSTLEGQPYEEGQEQNSSIDLTSVDQGGRPRRQPNGDLWRPEDENYYNPDKDNAGSSSGRWHYPANFDDVAEVPVASKGGKKRKEKKDRWARTRDAYSVPPDEESRKKKKKKRRSSATSSGSATQGAEFPEDPEGDLYGARGIEEEQDNKRVATTDEEVFNHQF